MKLGQAMKMAFKSISGSKVRSFLTMLGIIIGVASVMAIVSVMMGMTKQSLSYYEKMGTNRLEVYAYLYNGNSVFDDLYDYCLHLDQYVLGATPAGNMGATVIYEDKNSDSMEYSPSLYFGSDQYSVVNNFQIEKGRDLSKIDVDNYSNVCVMGARAAQNFFDFTDPVGKEVRVNGLPFTVIGVYKEKDAENSGWSMDNMILFPYTAARNLGQNLDMSQVYVKCRDANSVKQAKAMIEGFLTGICGDPNDWQNQKGYFYTYSDNQWQEVQNEQATMMSLVLGGIAGISLLVGGIGIMNIMLVTVTERTREIGIRRAIGAQRKSIVAQFLIEAGTICGIGGIFGVALGTILTLIGGKLLLGGMILWPSMGITLGAVLFSVLLGVIFGMYPAIKASGLQPVVALRAD